MVAERLEARPVVEETDGTSHREIAGAGVWVVSSFALLSGANYAFSLVLSRLLGITDYGSFGVLSSVLLLEGLIASSAFPWMLSAIVARFPGAEHVQIRSTALSTAMVGNIVLGLTSGAIVAFTVGRLIPGHPMVAVFGAVAALAICVNAVWLGLYQGERRFALLAFLRAGEAVLKGVFGIILIIAGFGLEGAVGGAIGGAVAMAVWGASRLRGVVLPDRHTWWDSQILPSVTWTAAAQLGLALLMNLDILSVRALGVGTNGTLGAGYYGASTLLARAPVFIGLAILNAIFPFLARRRGDLVAETHLVRMVLRVTWLIPVPAAVIFLAAPGPALRFFFPASYGPAVDLLRINAGTGIALIALAAAVVPLQAVNRMKEAAIAVVPALCLDVVAMAYTVPHFGTIGAAYSALGATTVGAILAWMTAARYWRMRLVLPKVAIMSSAVMLGLVTMIMPMPGRTWPVAAGLLMFAYLLLVWVLRGLSVEELLPLVPSFAHPPLQSLIRLEARWRDH
jgi:O-antigen/teichoic acid export membrane protein